MSLIDRFGFFDPSQPFSVTYGELPHWEQEGATYFITFRTADSLPFSVVELLTRQRDDWLRRNGIDPDRQDWVAALRLLSHDLQRAFHREYATKLEAALDQGHGACVLKRLQIGENRVGFVIAFRWEPCGGAACGESLRDSDDELRSSSPTKIQGAYHISDFVVMPNHVHVIVCFLPGVRLLAQCRSWKHFTAVELTRHLVRLANSGSPKASIIWYAIPTIS